MLRFEHPELLWLLLAVPALAAGFVGVHLWNRRLLRRFISPGLWSAVVPDISGVKRSLKQTLLLLGVACLVLALANPQIGTRLEEIKREGIDLFVAIDVSLSMKSEDVRPSRLEKAKRDVSSLLRKLAGDRVGLIVFAGDAFVQFPLTADYAAADLFISTIDVESVPTPGTMIGSAIEKALDSFTKDLPTQKAIIIVSDGENTEGDVLGAVEKASEAGVRVYTVGMGTLEGGPIPVGGADYKRDRDGNVVVSKLDESMLRQVSTATGGKYIRATSGGNEIDEVFQEIASLEKTEFGARQVTGFESRYQVPLIFAILFFLWEQFLSERRGVVLAAIKRALHVSAAPSGTALGIIVALTAVTAALPSTLSAQTVRGHVKEGNKLYEKGKFADAEAAYKQALTKDPTSGASHFNLGDAHFRQDRHEEAAREFGNAAMHLESGGDRGSTFYNMGNSFFRANKLDEAIESYKRALQNDPDDDDARHNLEVARNKKKQQEQQKQEQKKDQKKDQEQKQDQQQQDQKKDQDQKQDQNQQQQQQEQQQQDRTKQIQQKNQMPKEEAERMLEALRNNEKELQKKLQKRPVSRVRVEKDW